MHDIDPPRIAPSGTGILVGKDGPQVIHSSGKRWSEEAEAIFLDTLAATGNVTAAAAACGFSGVALYSRRRNDPAFARRWQAALEQAHARLNALLVQRAIEALEGFAPDPDTPIPEMTVKDALAILGHHRASVEGGPRSRRQWARPRSLDEVRDSILRELEAIAPAGSFETGPQSSTSAPPQDERGGDDGHETNPVPHTNPVLPEERGRTAERLEGPA